MAGIQCPNCSHTFHENTGTLLWRAGCEIVMTCAFCLVLYTTQTLPSEQWPVPHEPAVAVSLVTSTAPLTPSMRTV